MKRSWKAALWLSAACALSAGAAEPQRHQREDVLGTSFEMIVVDPDAAQANAAVDASLAEIARLDGILSTWKTDSELSRLNAGQQTQPVSDDLREVLRLCERWRGTTRGTFSCRLGGLLRTWRDAAQNGKDVVPDRVALRKTARQIAAIEVDPNAEAFAATPELQWQVDGLAKGYILDRALETARGMAPQATGIKIDIGGDAVYWGEPTSGQPWRVAIANPNAPRDNAGFIATLALRSHAIAASGHRTRGFRIGRRHYSHILDPLEGWPVDYAPSATVVAKDAATADALATALSVMPVGEGLALVETLPGVEVLIVGDRGVPFASSGWHALLDEETGPVTSSKERLAVEYEIPARADERYRRPHLALWISTASGEPVRQLLVLGDRSRWLRELPQWWRRYGRDDDIAAHGIAQPTREPGHYVVGWDGRDDYGRAVAPGRYVLQTEAAREHGGHELLSLPFVLGGEPLVEERQGHSEVGRVVLRQSVAPK